MLRFLIAMASLLSTYVLAQPKPAAVKLAFVDMQAAILQTDEGKAAKAVIEKEAEAKRGSLLQQQNELKKLDDEYQAQQAILSEQSKAEKQREFQQKLQNLRNAQANFEQEVRNKELQETQKIFKNLGVIVEEVARKKNYDIVFERGLGAVLYANKIDDITAEIVSIYNSRFKPKK